MSAKNRKVGWPKGRKLSVQHKRAISDGMKNSSHVTASQRKRRENERN